MPILTANRLLCRNEAIATIAISLSSLIRIDTNKTPTEISRSHDGRNVSAKAMEENYAVSYCRYAIAQSGRSTLVEAALNHVLRFPLYSYSPKF